MKLAEDVDLEQIAKDTHGFVGADLSQLCMEAALESIRSKVEEVDIDAEHLPQEVMDNLCIEQEHFRWALGH
eukprot:10426854-Prorocentrum_lima.AAC.1